MSWWLPGKLRQALTRGTSGVLVGLLALALGTPALAVTSHKSSAKPAEPPNCKHFPAHAMDHLIHVSPFVYKRGRFIPGEYDSCAWKTARVSGHYSYLLQIDLLVGVNRAVFEVGEQDAKKNAPKDNAVFSTIAVRGAIGAYHTVTVTDGKSLPPCPAGGTVDDLGPPTCNGDPAWETVAVDAYGALKPNGPKVELIVGVSGEPAVFVHGPALVAEQILSGRIR
jgi:hypothetical protein